MTLGIEILGGVLALLASVHMMILSRLVKRLDRLQTNQEALTAALAKVSERVARLESGPAVSGLP